MIQTEQDHSSQEPSALAGGLVRRPADARGQADHGWLQSAHSFSFANYYDPAHMQFETLRVINQDQVAAGAGFPMHAHKDAEIFSYVLEGALQHEDSLGNGSVVRAGGIQYMSAGEGVRHSEFNPSPDRPVRFYQIWLLPNRTGGSPHYDTMDLDPSQKDGKLKLFLSADGREGSMQMRADADIYAAMLTAKQVIETRLPVSHKAWVQLVKGTMRVNGLQLKEGDGLAIHQPGRIAFSHGQEAEFLYFDLKAGVSD